MPFLPAQRLARLAPKPLRHNAFWVGAMMGLQSAPRTPPSKPRLNEGVSSLAYRGGVGAVGR